MKAKFRETLWFKKGVLDAQVAAEADPTDVTALTAADLLPIEDRYDDKRDPLSAGDSLTYGIHTGTTEYLPVLDEGGAVEGHPIDERALVIDLKAGRKRVLAAIGVGAMMIVAAVLAFVG